MYSPSSLHCFRLSLALLSVFTLSRLTVLTFSVLFLPSPIFIASNPYSLSVFILSSLFFLLCSLRIHPLFFFPYHFLRSHFYLYSSLYPLSLSLLFPLSSSPSLTEFSKNNDLKGFRRWLVWNNTQYKKKKSLQSSVAPTPHFYFSRCLCLFFVCPGSLSSCFNFTCYMSWFSLILSSCP